MPLVKESSILPKKYSFIYMELRIYDIEHKKYKPYISEFNSDEAGNIQKIKSEKNKKNKKKKKSSKNNRSKKSRRTRRHSYRRRGKRYRKKPNSKSKSKKKSTKKTTTNAGRTTTEQKIYEERQKKFEGYFLHHGKIKQVYVFKDIINCSWNYDYEGLKGELSVTLPVSHDKVEKIYKGRRASLLLMRTDLSKNITDIKTKRTKALLDSLKQAEKLRKRQKKPKKKMVKDSVFVPFEDNTELKNVFEGFIKDVEIKAENMTVKIESYTHALEQEDLMTFRMMYRSDILKEIIKSAGMIPLIDTKGLLDEKINWTSCKQNEKQETGEALFGNDCTQTHQMSVKHGASHGKAGTGEDWDHKSKTGYAKKDSNYFKWATEFKNGEAMLISLRKMFKYKGYRNNRTCPQKLFNKGGFRCNCADASRLVKVCCDSIGFPCVIIHGNIYGGGHYWNAIKIKNTWKTFDLCYTTRSRGDSGGTNTSNLF